MDQALRYSQLLPYFGVAFILALLITPWIGRLARRIGAVDLPPAERSKVDKTRERRVHSHTPVLLGGLGMVLALLLTLILLGQLSSYPWGVIAGLLVVMIYGLLDDVFNLSAVHMLLFQLLAAFMVVVSGITVSSIQVAGVFIDLSTFTREIALGEFIYNYIFPADLLTILWIVGLMNVMNWVGGVDGLNGAVSAIISSAMLFISMRLGIVTPSLFLAAHTGALLGSLPYNYNLSKMFYGSVGDFGNGYILAVMSILAGTKLPLFLVIMGLPFFDALVVFIARVRRNHRLLLRPWKILAINDKTHFHHRLLDLGLSHKGVMFVEAGITAVLAALALLISDVRFELVAFIVAGALVLILIAILATIERRIKLRRAMLEQVTSESGKRVKVEVIREEEERKKIYRY